MQIRDRGGPQDDRLLQAGGRSSRQRQRLRPDGRRPVGRLDPTFRVARWLRAGGVGVNTTSRNVEAPIRGLRQSGMGPACSPYALHA
jgi:hypothetical protein